MLRELLRAGNEENRGTPPLLPPVSLYTSENKEVMLLDGSTILLKTKGLCLRDRCFQAPDSPWGGDRRSSAVLAIQQVADGLSPGFVCLGFCLALVGIHGTLVSGRRGFRSAAFGAAVGKTRLIGPQLELFGTDYAGSNGK